MLCVSAGQDKRTMIRSAAEFARLRTSNDLAEQRRASVEPASDETWNVVIAEYPEMRKWVAHNKSVPLTILATLARDRDPEVRWTVAMRRKLTRDLFSDLAADPDPTVRRRVMLNPKCPNDIRQAIQR